MMALKEKNKPLLLAGMIANLAILYGAIHKDAILNADWASLSEQWSELFKGSLALVFIGIINAQLSPEMKARIVFGRWSNALPGHEAFSRYGKEDPRVNLEELERQNGRLPSNPKEQNTLWYKLYKSVSQEASISQVHKEFLWTRDDRSRAACCHAPGKQKPSRGT